MECLPVKNEAAASLGKQDTDNAQDIEATEAIDDRDDHFAIRSEYNDQYLSPQLMDNPATDQGSAQERKIKEFNPKVKKVMSLSEQKLQCLLCYKKFSSKQETTDHIRTRHRITMAGSIDKSMRSVFT